MEDRVHAQHPRASRAAIKHDASQTPQTSKLPDARFDGWPTGKMTLGGGWARHSFLSHSYCTVSIRRML